MATETTPPAKQPAATAAAKQPVVTVTATGGVPLPPENAATPRVPHAAPKRDDGTVGDSPIPAWKDDDPFAAEKAAMMACVDRTRPTRPAGGFGLLRRLQATGTGAHCLRPFYDLLPTDRYGRRTGADVPAEAVLDAMLQMIEEDEGNPDVGVARLDRYTYDKATAIFRKGYWGPPTQYRPRLVNALPDVAFDPDADGDDGDEEEAAGAKGKRGRQKAKA